VIFRRFYGNGDFNICGFLAMFVEAMKYPAHRFFGRLSTMILCSLLCSGLFAQKDNNSSNTNSVPQLNQNSINSNQNTVRPQTNSIQQNEMQQFNPNPFQKRSDFGYTSARYLDSAGYYSEKTPLKAIDYIDKAIAQSINEHDKAKESSAYLILGNIQQNLQQHELAIENYVKCINVSQVKNKSKVASFSSVSQETLFQANKHMALSYIELGDLDKAETRINYSLGYVSVDPAEWLSARRILATIRLKQDRSPESLAILYDVLQEEKQNANVRGEAETYIALGDIYLYQKIDDKAIDRYTIAKTLAEKANLSFLALKANDQLAKIFRRQKNLTMELQARNSKISINTSNNNTQAVMKENIEIGNAYLNANQMNVAQGFFDKGLNNDMNEQQLTTTEDAFGRVSQQQVLFPKSNNLDETANTYKLLAEEYLRRRDPSKALMYFDKYAGLQDSIKHVRQRELNEALSLSTSLGKNQQKIDLLEKERQLFEQSMGILKQDKNLKEEQLGLKNIIIGVLIFFIFSMLMAGFFVMRSSREKRKVNQLLALKSLRGQMNPHFIFNALNSVNHYISQNDERKANRYLSDFSKLMRMVMDSSKHSLVPLNEELEMLRLYLQLEHTRFHDKFDYTFEISESLGDNDFELPPMLIQPYLENAVWHGLRYLDDKGKLALTFETSGSELLVTITDNGIGREKSKELKTHNQKKQASIGMQNIENRIVIMNDLFSTNIRVEIGDAYPGAVHCGTKVTLHIPQKQH
jgi:hypothetical protein